ncbi:carboxylate-amine ligase [Nocardia aurea]|uniref:carboxylate-amine ligase n=1 Tax=Nocardia aurea TaxID=2144174 RepID=UPI002FCDD909
MALTANSPIIDGVDTGHASWRHLLWARWPSAGPPPYLRSAAHYDDVVAKLVEDGQILDAAMVYWDVRLSAHLPTVEIRISDVPATIEETALFASLVRALVITAVADIDNGRLAVPIDQARLRWECRAAARDGLSSPHFRRTTRKHPVPGTSSIAELLSHIRPTLEESGDYEFTRDGLARVLREGNGAVRQRDALRNGGPENVVELLSRLTLQGCGDGGGNPARATTNRRGQADEKSTPDERELLQVEHVIQRLISRYPSVAPTEIELVVRAIHRRFADVPVHDFVPLLIEKAAGRAIGDRTTGPSDSARSGPDTLMTT